MFYIISIIIAGVIIAIDQITKYICVLKDVDSVVIPKLLKFELCYNTGSSFSFLSDKSWGQTFFKILTFIVLAIMVGIMVFCYIKKVKVTKLEFISVGLIFGGAVGNLIDRLGMSKVRDFIYVFYQTDIFPAIFNVADIGLVVGVFLLCFSIIFKKEEPKQNENVDNGK